MLHEHSPCTVRIMMRSWVSQGGAAAGAESRAQARAFKGVGKLRSLLLDCWGGSKALGLTTLLEVEVLGIGKYAHQDVQLAVSPNNKSRSQFALLSSAL